MLIAAAYDLGAVSLSGGYNTRRGNDEKGDDNELTVGLNVPMGNVNLSFGFATSKTEIGGSTAAKSSGFGVGHLRPVQAHQGVRRLPLAQREGRRRQQDGRHPPVRPGPASRLLSTVSGKVAQGNFRIRNQSLRNVLMPPAVTRRWLFSFVDRGELGHRQRQRHRGG